MTNLNPFRICKAKCNFRCYVNNVELYKNHGYDIEIYWKLSPLKCKSCKGEERKRNSSVTFTLRCSSYDLSITNFKSRVTY